MAGQHSISSTLAWYAMQLQGKSDARFVEATFKIFRDKFGLRPVLTTAQFLEQVRPSLSTLVMQLDFAAEQVFLHK